jgi:hypothetical protein
MLRLNLIGVCLMLACAHTRPDELTAEEHRAEATAHRSASERERAQYDPGEAVVVPAIRSLNSPPLTDWPTTYNPSAEHLAAADAELRKAADHLAAAKALESFEDAACASIPSRERAACPLLASAVSQVRQLPVGVELTLRVPADAEDVSRRLNCHLAYAVANGFEASCPLFVKGMRIRRSGPTTVELAGSTQAIALELQQQARRLFALP